MIFFSFIHFFSWLFLKLFLYFFSSHFFFLSIHSTVIRWMIGSLVDELVGHVLVSYSCCLSKCWRHVNGFFFQKILLSPISIWHYPKSIWLFDFDDDDDVNGLHLNIDHLYKKKNQSAIIFDGYMHMNFLFAHCRMHYH